MNSSHPTGSPGMGLVWIARHDTVRRAMAPGLTAGGLYDLGLVCCVESVDEHGTLTVKPHSGDAQWAEGTARMYFYLDVSVP